MSLGLVAAASQRWASAALANVAAMAMLSSAGAVNKKLYTKAIGRPALAKEMLKKSTSKSQKIFFQVLSSFGRIAPPYRAEAAVMINELLRIGIPNAKRSNVDYAELYRALFRGRMQSVTRDKNTQEVGETVLKELAYDRPLSHYFPVFLGKLPDMIEQLAKDPKTENRAIGLEISVNGTKTNKITILKFQNHWRVVRVDWPAREQKADSHPAKKS
ncbi:MAG: hypothetical protein J4215_04675 [Candidatus Diapherotrites archaeon]|uniref:Uncharacterized protein n=1 Tax=Candidatus Iainarchaeum sp. TaxID=3101447 RepID=A0A8T4L5G5_9ARCH|nr:hypothetical protein [Candidatus Diapherotrites archaeon]